MDSFHLGLLDFLGYQWNLRNLLIVVVNFFVVEMNDYASLYEEI